jgi:hypothetical protein
MQFLLDHPVLLGVSTALFLAGTIEAGRQLAGRSGIQEDAHRREQMVALRDGLFVLVGLLIGFTLALAAPRYAERRALLIDEANIIGSTYLRADTLAQPTRDESRQLLRQYVDAHLDFDDSGLDRVRSAEAMKRIKQIQDRIWGGYVDISRSDRSPIIAAYMNSIIQMIELHEKRIAAIENRIPLAVWLLIFFVSAIANFARGLTLTRRFWLTLVLSPLTIAIVITLIADLDTPNSGLIRTDDRAMQRLQTEMRSR